MAEGNIVFGGVDESVRHVPVMLNEVLDCLQPVCGKLFLDGTFGAGGYSRALLEAGAHVIGIDRDPDAIGRASGLARAWQEKLTLRQGEFSKLDQIASATGHDRVDGVVLDIGVSSMQFDQAERGFSFRENGPLDMRMARTGVSAADVLNAIAQPDLTRLIGILGEERKASRISREIVRARQTQPIITTFQLSSIIERVIHRSGGERIHPATRTFQALRIFVNQELEQLGRALFAAERLLREGGRLVVVTFHSLEDRIVKQFFRDRCETAQGSRHLPSVDRLDAIFRIPGKNVVKPGADETEKNPRSRSAKLRWGIRTGAYSRTEDFSIFNLANLVPLASFASNGEQ